MIIGIISWILSIIGIYGFFNNMLFLTYIGMVATIIELIIGTINGENKSLGLPFVCIIISIILTTMGNTFLNSLSITLCFYNAITFTLGLLFIIFNLIFLKKDNTN